MLNSEAAATQVLPHEFIELLPLLWGIFTIRHNDINNNKTDKITTYAWYRFEKNAAGEVCCIFLIYYITIIIYR